MATSVIQLPIHHVDWSQNTLFSNWHRLVVDTHAVNLLEVALTHSVALLILHHQVRLDRWYMAKSLQLDTIVDC